MRMIPARMAYWFLFVAFLATAPGVRAGSTLQALDAQLQDPAIDFSDGPPRSVLALAREFATRLRDEALDRWRQEGQPRYLVMDDPSLPGFRALPLHRNGTPVAVLLAGCRYLAETRGFYACHGILVRGFQEPEPGVSAFSDDGPVEYRAIDMTGDGQEELVVISGPIGSGAYRRVAIVSAAGKQMEALDLYQGNVTFREISGVNLLVAEESQWNALFEECNACPHLRKRFTVSCRGGTCTRSPVQWLDSWYLALHHAIGWSPRWFSSPLGHVHPCRLESWKDEGTTVFCNVVCGNAAARYRIDRRQGSWHVTLQGSIEQRRRR